MNCDISGSNLLRILPSFDFFCGWIRYRISYVNSRALLADFEKVGDEGGRADHRLGIMSMVGNGELAYTPEGRSARSVLTQIRYFCGPRRQLGEFSWGGNYGVRVFSCQCMWRLVGVYLKKKKKKIGTDDMDWISMDTTILTRENLWIMLRNKRQFVTLKRWINTNWNGLNFNGI